jgi:hypothetical protein
VSLLFSQHDEFTYYALLGLANFEDRYQRDCWKVAQSVHGWGRIHAVKALVGTFDKDAVELQDWLVREGFHNTVGDGYLALLAVEEGRLVKRLEAAHIDLGLLHATGILLAALLDPDSPGPNLGVLPESLALVRHYLRHLSQLAQLHMHQPTLLRLRRLLQEFPLDSQDFILKLQKHGWSSDAVEDLRDRLQAVIKH